MVNDKIKIVLPVEKNHQLRNGKKIHISKTKNESSLSSFQQETSISNKIALQVAEDPLLLTLLFLKSDVKQLFSSSGITLTIPLILNSSYDFEKKSFRAQ